MSLLGREGRENDRSRGAEVGTAVTAQIEAWEAARLRCANALRALTGAAPLPTPGTPWRHGADLAAVIGRLRADHPELVAAIAAANDLPRDPGPSTG